MADERSVDEYLGFAHTVAEERRSAGAGDEAADHVGAYEDGWYQVLKAKADEDENA